MPDDLTFEDAHAMLLDKLDQAYKEIRYICQDTEWTNNNEEAQSARVEFERVLDDIWQIKNVWRKSKNLNPENK